jgi:hypothetical protein
MSPPFSRGFYFQAARNAVPDAPSEGRLVMSDKKSFFAYAAVAVLAAVGLAACGGTPLSSTGPSAVVASTDDAAPMVIFSNVFEDVEMGEQRITDISLPHAGTLVVTLRWNDQIKP